MTSIKAIELYKYKNHLILIAAIPFKELKNIVVFTQRNTSDWSDNKSKLDENQYYQRTINPVRVKNIKKYIKESIFATEQNEHVIFPSSTILSFDIDDTYMEINEMVENLTIPTEKESCLIVDGQHRMKAMMELYEEYSESLSNSIEANKILDYKFNCTILVGYDLWEQSQIFASVNFNQKPVDRSLYYDIFGSALKEGKNERSNNLYVAHKLGKFLNSSEKSPLKGFVKDFNSKDGFYSQSFFTQNLIRLLGSRSAWNSIIEDYKLSDESRGLHKKLPKVFVAYFNVIKEIFQDYWPKDNKKENATLLVKTTIMGAFLRLLGRINELYMLGLYPKKDRVDLLEQSINDIEKLFREIFEKFNPESNNGKELAKKFFGENSQYKGGGSSGLQSKLYRELSEVIGITA